MASGAPAGSRFPRCPRSPRASPTTSPRTGRPGSTDRHLGAEARRRAGRRCARASSTPRGLERGLGGAGRASILPLPLLGGPDDPRERLDAMLRLAPPPRAVRAGRHRLPDRARAAAGSRTRRAAIVVDGLRAARRARPSALGLRIALEPYQRDGGEEWTIVSTIPEALELIREAGDSPALAAPVRRVASLEHRRRSSTTSRRTSIASPVSTCATVRAPTRGWADRVAPGDGIAGVPRSCARSTRPAGTACYDIEIFSDNGTFGTPYHDSLWAAPGGGSPPRSRRSRRWQAARRESA